VLVIIGVSHGTAVGVCRADDRMVKRIQPVSVMIRLARLVGSWRGTKTPTADGQHSLAWLADSGRVKLSARGSRPPGA